MITIFTPTYNRAYTLKRLFQSLVSQTNQDFEWLVIDDGSTDNTESLINSFMLDDQIRIRYFKQVNGGKHRAINKGVKLAKGELFFIVDSDDYLDNNAVELISNCFLLIEDRDDIAAVTGLKAYFDGSRVGGDTLFNSGVFSLFYFRYRLKIMGDLAEVFKTCVLKEFPFPEIENEKFCPEALVWYQIAKKYNYYFLNEKIYYCEYIADGLTANILRARVKSPISSFMCYNEVRKCDVPLLIKIKSTISSWRFGFHAKSNIRSLFKEIGYVNSMYLPLGLVMYFIDRRKLNKNAQ